MHCDRHGETEVTRVEPYPKSLKYILACGDYKIQLRERA